MRPTLLITLALRSVLRSPTRSALTMLGVVIGVASVVVMVAIGTGAQSEVQARIRNLGTNMVIITPGAATTGGVSGGAGTQASLTVEDAELLLQESQTLSLVSPVVMTRSSIVFGEVNWRATTYGVDTAYQEIRDWSIAEGRFFDEDEVLYRRKVLVLGATIAALLFPEGDAVGARVRLREVPFDVVGVLTRKGQTAEGVDQDDVVLAPYTTVRTRLAGRQFIGQILGSAWSEHELASALIETRALMRQSHRLSAWQDDDFEVRDQRQLAEAAQGTARVMTRLLFAIASVSLLVGGIGIMNIMLVSVTERTREIGIRRALGARRRDVLAQFLVEAVVLSGLGGLLGAALGLGGAQLVGSLTGWTVEVHPSTIGLALGFSAAVGVLFGWAPARRAANLDPIEALRSS